MSGKFYGVSVGPGDSELLTLKAVRVIEACPVVASPATKGENMLAFNIAKGTVNMDDKEILPLEFLMTRDKEAQHARHVELAKLIAAKLDEDKDVAMLNLGDASLFSTFSYILKLLEEMGYEAEVVPGVTSFCAIAAKLKVSLTSMNEPLHIIPASHGCTEEALHLRGSKVLMKAGKGLGEVKQELKKAGLYEKASLISDCGLPSETICVSLDEAKDDMGYFATIVVRGE